MTKLHFIPHPQLDESPRSLLSRTAAFNGFQSVEKFARAFLSEINIKPLEWQLDNSAMAIKLDKLYPNNNLKAHFYTLSSKVTRGGPIAINQVLFPQELLRTREHLYCPQCIKEGWSRFIQDIVLVDDCPYHNCRYESHCPSCKQSASWTANNGTFCRCGFDLTTTPPTKSDAKFSRNLLALIIDKQQAAIDTLQQALKSLRFGPASSSAIRTTTLNLAMNIVINVEGSVKQAIRDHIMKHASAPVEFFATPWLSIKNERIVAAAKNATLELANITMAPNQGTDQDLWLYKSELEQLGITSRKLMVLTQEGLIHKRRMKIKTPFQYLSTDWYAVLNWVKRNKTGNPLPLTHDDDHCNAETAARLLDVYPEAVRRAVKAGFMTDRLEFRGRSMFILNSEVLLFQENYVFVGPLAKILKTPNTTLTARLASVNINPVSGPTVDAGLVSVYKKSDLDEEKIKQCLLSDRYPNATGRKKSPIPSNPKYISATETAHILGFEIQRLKYLKTCNLLVEATPLEYRNDNKRYFTLKSVMATKAILEAAISFEEACETLQIDGPQLARRFIKSGFIEPLTFGKRKFIRNIDYQRIQENLKTYCSCAQLDSYLGAPSRHSANLVATGRIAAADANETKINTIRLISWSEIKKKF